MKDLPMRAALSSCLAALLFASPLAAQSPRPLMPIPFENSAEHGWLMKPVHARRVLDDMTDASTWLFSGTGSIAFPAQPATHGMRFLRVDLQMFVDSPAPTRNRLSAVHLRREFAGEDWSSYNRISLWVRPEFSGIAALPLQIAIRNDGAVKVPDRYNREGIHYVTLRSGAWQQVVWEIAPLARDRITAVEIGYWVNRMLAAPSDHVSFEIAGLELQRVDADHYAGWSVAPGRIAFSHSGYLPSGAKAALASGLAAPSFRVLRVDDSALGDIVHTGAVETVRTRLGEFQRMDFSAVEQPGTYILEAGDVRTRSFRIGDDAWRSSILKTLNWLYGQRCGWLVPGSHDIDHRDWFAVHGEHRIPMNGGWHDAGDLSQGMVNTGETVYALFALADRLRQSGRDPELLERVLEEAKWGLEWVLRVRFDGGYRIGFASHNLWTNGIIGDADDRTREARNNPNVNYIAAAAAAIAYRVLRDSDPQLAARSLAVATDDWRHAIDGVEGPETWSTPAFAATPMELAGIGTLASLELYEATGEQAYAEKALDLARTITTSQQKRFVGSAFPLAGFFHTGPDRVSLFNQFHRGNDQAPIVALARLLEVFPAHADWMSWYSTIALYADYQKRSAGTTTPWHVLPAYVYRDTDHLEVPAEGALHGATREAFREQVLQGMPMGDGYYLRAFPVWFARRGNYGVLLSQAKALATAARVRSDADAASLAHAQAQWIVGRNPFVQSTLYGEGYDWAQQYAVSSGDFVGALPVGMQSHGTSDLPYWPSQNMYVYKEVWIHPVARWLWLMADIAGPMVEASARRAMPELRASATTAADGSVAITLAVTGSGTHAFSLRTHNLGGDHATRSVTLQPGRTTTLQWRARVRAADEPWYAVIIPDGDVTARQEVNGVLPRYDVPPGR